MSHRFSDIQALCSYVHDAQAHAQRTIERLEYEKAGPIKLSEAKGVLRGMRLMGRAILGTFEEEQ